MNILFGMSKLVAMTTLYHKQTTLKPIGESLLSEQRKVSLKDALKKVAFSKKSILLY